MSHWVVIEADDIRGVTAHEIFSETFELVILTPDTLYYLAWRMGRRPEDLLELYLEALNRHEVKVTTLFQLSKLN